MVLLPRHSGGSDGASLALLLLFQVSVLARRNEDMRILTYQNLYLDTEYMHVGEDAQQLWILFMHCPFESKCPGLQSWDVQDMSFYTGLSEEATRAALECLERLNVVEYDALSGVLCMPSLVFISYDREHNDIRSWFNGWKNVKECPAKFKHLQTMYNVVCTYGSTKMKAKWDETFGTLKIPPCCYQEDATARRGRPFTFLTNDYSVVHGELEEVNQDNPEQ
jgi:hypothetical protein